MNLEIVSAGAGSGKTYDLTMKVAQAIQEGLAPDHIMATTFTNVAADELLHRVREKLLSVGRRDAAEGILGGLVGTINSTMGNLLTLFCWNAGLPPTLQVVEPDDAKVLFRSALAAVQDNILTDRFRQAVERLSLSDDWEAAAKNIADQARTNAISPDELRHHADRSWEALQGYFSSSPMSREESIQWERQTKMALEAVINGLHRRTLTQKNETDGLGTLESIDRKARYQGHITWWDWMRLAGANAGAKNKDLVEPLKNLASAAFRHPLLVDDMKVAIQSIFEMAAGALEIFQTMKKDRGLIDFVDQESILYGLMEYPEVRSEFSRRIHALWVDEFQDCSPLQLALLTEISLLINQASWVGDPKQAIYGFRGADPELMDWAIRELGHGQYRILGDSHRSRPELVSLVNDLFTPVFQRQDIPRDRVQLRPHRKRVEELSPPFELWRLQAKNQDQQYRAIASGINDILNDSSRYLVDDHGRLRPIRGSDIAVLCRKNDSCTAIAAALSQFGIRAIVGREGLFDVPETHLTLAALRYLWDKEDSLAVAELLHLGSPLGEDREWLSQWLDPECKEQLLQNPRIVALNQARQSTELTLSELLDRAMVAIDIFDVVAGWGESDVRRGNLEKLRGLAQGFESRTQGLGLAPTVPAFLGYIEDIRSDKKNDGNKQSKSQDIKAVNVLTYHGAKGLEWPMVILTFQSRPPEATPFEVRVLSPIERTLKRPLDGRWIRYWPWPFGLKRHDVGLDATMAGAPAIMEAEQRLVSENSRLLYVGMTRARDYLVWAFAGKSVKDLDVLSDGDGVPVFQWPTLGATEMVVGGACHSVVQKDLVYEEVVGQTQDMPSTIWVLPKSKEAWSRVPRHIAPSHSVSDKIHGSIEETVALGDRIPLVGTTDMERLGLMVHGFIAAAHNTPQEQWPSLAQELIDRWGISYFQPSYLIEAKRRYQQFLQSRWPGFKEQVEWPVQMKKGNQLVSGWIDSLWEGPQGYIIVDHKTFPGREEQWDQKALGYVGQLERYHTMVTQASSKPVLEMWIHFPVVSRMLRIGVI